MVLGSAMSAYGANKSSKAIDKASAANQKAQEEANRIAWSNYLLQRGINPRGNVQPGVVPTDYDVVNARLPLWATMSVPRQTPANTPAGAQTGATRPRLRRA